MGEKAESQGQPFPTYSFPMTASLLSGRWAGESQWSTMTVAGNSYAFYLLFQTSRYSLPVNMA